ncbi:MAG: D-alanyl-D-alanine carboxypeptidase [Acidocella sp.]|nr:D-alanyl-D-alanine carboxypeptidase [Acidocella sp.]
MAKRHLRSFIQCIAAASACVFAAGLLAAPAAQARIDQSHAAPTTNGVYGPTSPGTSSILIDAATGRVLTASGADIPRYPASLTKLMTLDLAFQALRDGHMTLDTPISISDHAASVQPVKLGLAPGSTITVRQAILAMTTMSANDAATALGEYLGGGSEVRCSEMMTQRAHALGMAQTRFYNASGLPNPYQVSTARDLAILARDIVITYPQDQQFFEVQKFDLDGHTIYSNNTMLKTYPGVTGMKTGYTVLARHNLVTSAQRDGRTLIGVELHEPSWGATYQQMTAMLDSGFDHSQPATVAVNLPPASAPVTHAVPSFIASADAATVRPLPAPAVRSKPHEAPTKLASNRPASTSASWTAEVGSYKYMNSARAQALAVRKLRGEGIARVARIEVHGKVTWAAQLIGLSHEAAHATCTQLSAHGASCVIIPPQADHLAARTMSDG